MCHLGGVVQIIVVGYFLKELKLKYVSLFPGPWIAYF